MYGEQVIGELVLIRHGKAQDSDGTLADEQRALTAEGRAKLQTIMPDLKQYLRDRGELQLWTSPLLRAVQTAEILAAELGLPNLQKFTWIAGCSPEALKEELARLPAPFNVLLVGHEPDLSSLGYQISGIEIPFKKGTMVGYSVLSLEPFRAKPSWLAQPEMSSLQELELRDNRPALLEFKKILTSYLYDIFHLLNSFELTPQEPEAAHQLRVKIRACRSLLAFIKPLLNQKEYSLMQAELREIALWFAHLREVDVLQSDWQELFKLYTELDGAAPGFAAILQAERVGEVNAYSLMSKGAAAERERRKLKKYKLKQL